MDIDTLIYRPWVWAICEIVSAICFALNYDCVGVALACLPFALFLEARRRFL